MTKKKHFPHWNPMETYMAALVAAGKGFIAQACERNCLATKGFIGITAVSRGHLVS